MATDKPKAARLIGPTGADGTLIASNNVAVSVDGDGVVSIMIPESEMALHPRAVALVAAAMRLEDDEFVGMLVNSLNES